ncbi:hypothetical protein COEREDRAFT_11312 [Coemansia reversa NRRL 1564]|uniref:Peptidase S1 domain-containing protein n=1 Tax=Coemansia reversa (strain ATCC 12441 / NRRL 1564) TaxID=763665 RepID=A0A2G5B3F5_COERN|nr:hypothetical protein COEREDRAFT_11312 [Coemansia reversa NRRL 1564]|eukprot:PIA13552.1 hypothetical protein COEREDRAFT_11312 [Coemansia reversa NRRL 1564]
MKTLKVLSKIAVSISMLGFAAAGQHTFVKRLKLSRVNDLRGGILVKNGMPTTCEVAVTSEQVAFVAAACLNFKENSNDVDSSIPYEVWVTGGDTESINKYMVNGPISHPKYNPETYANNVAVLKLSGNKSAGKKWVNYIAANPKEWESEFYTKRSVSSSGSFDTPQVVDSNLVLPSECSQASTLYAANTEDILCTSQTATNGSCPIPYTSAYGVHSPDLAIAALYSHSVVVGDKLCESSAVYSYYTILSNYLEWGGAVTGSTIYLYTADMNYQNNNDPNYHMNDPNGKANIDGIVIAGNLNENKENQEPLSSDIEIISTPSTVGTGMPTVANNGITPSSTLPESTEGSSADDSNKRKTLSTILIVVAVILLVLAVIGYLLYRRFKKRQPPTNEMTQYNNNDYSLGAQTLRPEYIENHEPNRQHLDNEIITSREDYQPNSYNDNGKDRDLMS